MWNGVLLSSELCIGLTLEPNIEGHFPYTVMMERSDYKSIGKIVVILGKILGISEFITVLTHWTAPQATVYMHLWGAVKILGPMCQTIQQSPQLPPAQLPHCVNNVHAHPHPQTVAILSSALYTWLLTWDLSWVCSTCAQWDIVPLSRWASTKGDKLVDPTTGLLPRHHNWLCITDRAHIYLQRLFCSLQNHAGYFHHNPSP